MGSFLLGIFLWTVVSKAAEPNPPTWPPHVFVFDDSNASYAQSVVDAVYKENGGTDPALNGQFSNDRFAFLFKVRFAFHFLSPQLL